MWIGRNMHVSTFPMNRTTLSIAVSALLLAACSGEPEPYENSAAPSRSTLQVNQQDEARRNLEEASRPYSLGDSTDESMGRASAPAPEEPLDDQVADPVMENRT